MAIKKRDIEEKIAKIRSGIKDLKQYSEECEKIFETDPILKDAILFRLYTLSDRVISLAEMVCKFSKLGYPLTYSEFIYRLGDAGIIDKEFAYNFANIARFRNFLAYDYEDIEKEKICKIMLENLDEVEEFIQQIESSIGV